ncbi:hypothetical protein L228DRAFT_286334 [Xylona heveae TC161]|uniref:Uncharacterized protein n=1 Tax=Xylona heveae (strain CBS 132557 / TC161) TaxID=1328760 RepID=A0A164Z973_XYLHT|nr:hypothetical protein L228DRAFT_286334 [Xylona heveae TC161]KZF18836.1 hypothetical protein L228DRAFT_286334 [Xylona heveae TC161]
MSSWATKLAGLSAPMNTFAEKAVIDRMAANSAIKNIKLKGTKLHKSHDGSGKNVISIQMLNEKNARVETIHVDENGDVDVKKKSQ